MSQTIFVCAQVSNLSNPFSSTLPEASSEPEGHPDEGQELYEAFTAVQWATYGERKSNIASRTCHLNGELKAYIILFKGGQTESPRG